MWCFTIDIWMCVWDVFLHDGFDDSFCVYYEPIVELAQSGFYHIATSFAISIAWINWVKWWPNQTQPSALFKKASAELGLLFFALLRWLMESNVSFLAICYILRINFQYNVKWQNGRVCREQKKTIAMYDCIISVEYYIQQNRSIYFIL